MERNEKERGTTVILTDFDNRLGLLYVPLQFILGICALAHLLWDSIVSKKQEHLNLSKMLVFEDDIFIYF